MSLITGEQGLFAQTNHAANMYKERSQEEKNEFDSLMHALNQYSKENTNVANVAYHIGDEVTVNGQSFYVLEDSDIDESMVTLLTKYNLNKEGTAQAVDKPDSETNVNFSSNNYWRTPVSSYTGWENKQFDISTVNGNEEGDAITKAQNYAKIVTGDTNNNSGRLLRYEEATELIDSYEDMICGKANKNGNSSYYLNYWLSSAYGGNLSEGDEDIAVWAVWR